ncbi:MAG: cysteine desulfurase-like protein [Gemmatimonadales bacterium]
MSNAVRTVESIRADFPALAREHNGKPIAFFDGPGGTQVPQVVIDAMVGYLTRHNANTHWDYPTSHETDAMIQAAREAFADFFNCAADEVVFGQNMTTLTFHLSRGIANDLGHGDEIVVTQLDHHGNVAPWDAIARERDLLIHRVPFDSVTGTHDMDRLLGAINERTRVVAIGLASNAIGTVNDVATVCRVARERGALSYVDAVHGAAHQLPDVQALGCDFLVCSPYKFYGPHLGVLFGRRPLLEAVAVPKLEPAPDTAPERLETGTLSHEAIVGAHAAVDYLASIAPRPTRRASLAAAFDALHGRGASLFERLWSGVGQVRGVRRYGLPPGGSRTPTIGFTLDGVPSQAIARHLADHAVFVSHGDFYALSVIQGLGQGEHGIARAGIACYTDESEIDRLVAGVAELAKRVLR